MQFAICVIRCEMFKRISFTFLVKGNIFPYLRWYFTKFCYFRPIWTESEPGRQILVKISNIKFHEKSLQPHYDVTNLTAAFRNCFTKESKFLKIKKKSYWWPVSLHSSPPFPYELLAHYVYGEVPQKFYQHFLEASRGLHSLKIYQPELPDNRQFLHIKTFLNAR